MCDGFVRPCISTWCNGVRDCYDGNDEADCSPWDGYENNDSLSSSTTPPPTSTEDVDGCNCDCTSTVFPTPVGDEIAKLCMSKDIYRQPIVNKLMCMIYISLKRDGKDD